MQKTLSNPFRQWPASYVLFLAGVVSYFLGAVLLFWQFETIKGIADLPKWLFDKSIWLLLLSLLCWMLAPFLSKHPLWMKIGLSVGLIVIWWLTGYLFAAIAPHIAGLSNL
jgi:hypothetical protein